MCFAIFPAHLSKLLRLPWKSHARSYEVLHLSRKIISANLKILGSKMQPLSGNQRPDLLTALMNMSLVLRQILFKCPTPAIAFGNATKPSRFAHFWQSAQSLAPATRNDIWTSKSGPKPWSFSHFNFEMCFAPQPRALFRHLNFQKWSEHGVFLTFSLRNVLRATTACTFSTSQLPKVVRTWCFVHFDFEICFAPQRRALFPHLNFQKWSEHGASWLSYLFVHLHLLSSDSFSSLIFSFLLFSSLLFSSSTLTTSAVHLPILSEVWLPNFLRQSSAGKCFVQAL